MNFIAPDLIYNDQLFSQALVTAWDALWQYALSSQIYLYMQLIGMVFAVAVAAFFIFKWARDLNEGKGGMPFAEILWPLIVAIFLKPGITNLLIGGALVLIPLELSTAIFGTLNLSGLTMTPLAQATYTVRNLFKSANALILNTTAFNVEGQVISAADAYRGLISWQAATAGVDTLLQNGRAHSASRKERYQELFGTDNPPVDNSNVVPVPGETQLNTPLQLPQNNASDDQIPVLRQIESLLYSTIECPTNPQTGYTNAPQCLPLLKQLPYPGGGGASLADKLIEYANRRILEVANNPTAALTEPINPAERSGERPIRAHIAFSNMTEMAMLLIGLLGPIPLGMSLFPGPSKALYGWLAALLGLGTIKLSFSVIVAIVSVIVYASQGLDSQWFAEALATMAIPLAITIGGTVGVIAFAPLSSIGAYASNNIGGVINSFAAIGRLPR